jgi:triosephosphate isomerase (TIM)
MGTKRTLLIAGNWKMHKTIAESVKLAQEVVSKTAGAKCAVMIAPAFTALAAVRDVVKGSHVRLGAQNMGPAPEGAHTGEVSCKMLRDVGVSHVILGHSERRHTYLEPDALINSKVKLAVAEGFTAILCVGETLAEREQGLENKVVENQVLRGLDGLVERDLERVVIAYEPVWAIGTGKNATPEDANGMHRFVRGILARMYGREASEKLVIQYGGSVKPDNARALMAMEHIDGALVGGAALKAETFVPIVFPEGH